METNKNGCVIERSFNCYRERYYYDSKLKGFEQYDTDQDAPYFGVWINHTTLETVTFAEGDTTKVRAPNKSAFDAELSDMDEFYGVKSWK